jgi:hypothetical protein
LTFSDFNPAHFISDMLSSESAYHDLAVVIDGLRAESSETRIASATQLKFISEGLGPERTREVRSTGGGNFRATLEPTEDAHTRQ